MFHDVRFPLSIGLAARGGPERRTRIVERASGFEERNGLWANSRRYWDAAPGLRSLDDIARIVAFFEARNGRLHAFRFTDPLDHKSCDPSQDPTASDQIIGTGDGLRKEFELTKRYQDAAGEWVRFIEKPVTGSVRGAVDGIEQTVMVNAEGMLVFDSPPASGSVVSAGYQFDVPARFDTDRLEIGLDGFKAGEISSVPIAEVRL